MAGGKGFMSPSILFLNTYDQPERDYEYGFFRAARAAGYTRIVELCAGSFVMPSIAVTAGWPATALDCSDVSLFSSVLGAYFSDQPFEALDVRVDDVPITFTETTRAGQAAELLYTQLVLRHSKQADDVAYWEALVHDLISRRAQHIAEIVKTLEKLDGRLHGLRYRPIDLWEHLAEVEDDPHTLVSSNPPSYKAGFEKFFDTAGRLTWAEPPYRIFEPPADAQRLMEHMADKAALVVLQQQQPPGEAAPHPVYARHLGPGQVVYLCANRPDEVCGLVGGLKVMPYRGEPLQKLPYPTIASDAVIRPEATLEVLAVGHAVAAYYRDLWSHKLDYRQASANLALLLDGQLAGMAGYDTAAIYRPYPAAPDTVRGALILTYAFAPPHDRRLVRLVTMAALTREALDRVLAPQLARAVERLITVELTKHPEAKGLRGLMKLQHRRTDAKYGYRLVYGTDVSSQPLSRLPADWLTKEERWEAQRTSAASA